MAEYVRRSTTLHFSLNQPKLIMGVERGIAILNFTMAAAVIMGTGMLLWIPITILFHMILAWMTKQDPLMRQIYIRFIRQATSYDPWPHSRESAINQRPLGFDHDNLC